ncbi:hypothetical protein F5B20DRAFT_588538 [Whalleya microplaca]|nr:hypothetical protein F5B20DRAFT_588538 [Whalleya microplaca]
MAQVYRERDIRYTREDSPSSDDDKYTTTTVRRYKVGGGPSGSRVVERDRIERYEEDDDRRSRHSHHSHHSHSHSHSNTGRPSGELLEVDRRVERTTERPRSRTSEYYRDDDRYRTVEYEREREVDHDYHYPERHRTKVVEESTHVSSPPPRDNYWERQSRAPWDDPRETDVRIDKRVVHRESDGDLHIKEKTIDKHSHSPRGYDERDLKIERRIVEEDYPHDGEIERYRKETDYYAAPDPPPAPVIIRNKAPEQKIVIQEAPSPAPVIVPRQEPSYIVLRERDREVVRRPEPREDDDYYRHRRDDRRDSFDEDYYVKRTIIKRDSSASSDHHRRRHLAEGALAGAGLGALVGGGNRGRDGEYHDHRGRKVLAGAALGALGSEAIRRAKSAYEDRYEDRYDDGDDYYRHRHHRSKSRSRLTTGLAIGAAALAVAGGLKYMQNNKIEKEEATRGRARRRHSVDDYSRSPSRSSRGRSRSKSKSNSNMAKAAVATGAVAGLVNHYRSKSRGKSRSKSRLRTGAEIAAAGLTGAAASKLWERHKDKKDRDHHRELDDEHYDRDPSLSRSRSKSRSHSRHSHSRDSTADRELGLVPVIPGVEYGSEPLDGYESASEERRHRPHHRHRQSSPSDQETPKKRSQSRLREVAAAGLGTAAAAIGLKKYHDRQKSKERDERSRDRSGDRSLGREDRDRERDRGKDKGKSRRSRDRERRRYEEEVEDDPYYNYDPEAPPSPPHASGGAYYPPEGPIPPPPAGPAGFTQHPNMSTTNVNAYPPYPYNPQNYTNFPPPPPAGPPHPGPTPPGPENVSRPYFDDSQPHPNVSRSAATKQDGVRHRGQSSPSPSSRSTISITPAQIASKVRFSPLSPKSSRTLRKHHQDTGDRSAGEADDEVSSSSSPRENTTLALPRNSMTRKRAGSDSSSDRPRIHRRRRRGDQSPNSDDDDASRGDVEYLPDRFDASGRPLDPTTSSVRRGGNIRRGSFEYRPRRPDDWDIRGAWITSGDADPDRVMRDLADTFGGLLQQGSRSGLFGLLGNALEGVVRERIRG